MRTHPEWQATFADTPIVGVVVSVRPDAVSRTTGYAGEKVLYLLLDEVADLAELVVGEVIRSGMFQSSRRAAFTSGQ